MNPSALVTAWFHHHSRKTLCGMCSMSLESALMRLLGQGGVISVHMSNSRLDYFYYHVSLWV